MNKTYTFLSILFLGLVFASCTKEEELAPLPQDKIVEYSVNNVPAGTSLYGAIDDEKKTITLYVPFYLGLELIDADITVSPGAKLQEEILPIPIDTEDQTYTVIATDGSTNTYTLLIVSQNTPDLEAVWGIYNYPAIQPTAYPVGILPYIHGNFYSNNINLIKLTLVSRNTQKAVQLNTREGRAALAPLLTGDEPYRYRIANLTIPMDIDTGYHDVKIAFLGHQVTLADPINIQYRSPRINYSSGKAMQQGGEVVYNATPQYLILEPTSVKATYMESGTTYDFPIVKYDMESVTLKVPDNIPTGRISVIFQTTYKNWPTTTNSTSITVTPK
ncbi:hypothetical protein [Sphingobacterium gobiense]|uniref:DUF1735 domain-containing protein n=1 Tax=Sphingobacterium gobiense TaxID=1382456 RepID=A0A2S9JRP7_9SPHI|nr:hypothetical protein [Sphingobacterium gobiense]PRD55811.1 hypothetical protein C5749_00495 [Sphingobacterium gobiense]